MVSLTLASAKKRIRTHGWVAVVRPGPYGPLSGVRLRLVGIDSRGDTNDADKCGPVLSLDDEMCWYAGMPRALLASPCIGVYCPGPRMFIL